jgi:glycosyltransferase involved in cell wall biosynthesis
MIARDEEAILPRTLESVRWADEIVIVDSGSIDRTPEIAREFGARHHFHRDFRGHAEQKNIAIKLCTSDWILLLDADEAVSAPLAAEIQQVMGEGQFDAFWMPRSNLFLTRWLRHGGFYPDKKLRLFKRGVAHVEEGVGPHGTPVFQGPAGTLKHDLLHYAYPELDLYIEHMNRYSSEAADVLIAKERAISSAALIGHGLLNPLLTFVKNYIFRLGFLDGMEGLVLHLNHSFYVHWKYAKIWEAGRPREANMKLSTVHHDIQSGLRARPPD